MVLEDQNKISPTICLKFLEMQATRYFAWDLIHIIINWYIWNNSLFSRCEKGFF